MIIDTIGSPFTEHTVTTTDFRIRYLEAGQGDPLVVLHGAGGIRFSHALDMLAWDRRVILVEMPGFGDEPNDRSESLAELAEAVAEAIEAIGVDHYDLLGTSMGGATAVHIALDHPDRVRSLVLDAPATFRVGSTPPGPGLSSEDMLRKFRVHPERQPVFEAPDPESMARRWPLVSRLLASRPEYDDDVAARLPDCQIPTLVLFGDRDGIVPPENGRIFRRLMPSCTYVLIHSAAHDAQGDRPEAFAETVGDFLDRGLLFLIPEQSSEINP
jgi:pimeloyl-ACP methyl ester carboxylesterase